MAKNLILTDIDDTVLQCSHALQDFVETELNIKARIPFIDAKHFSDSFNITELQWEQILIKFWNSVVFGKLPPEPCATLILPQLYAEGYRFIAITACPSTPAIIESRKYNLQTAFGFKFERIYCTALTGKQGILEKYKDEATCWVEDNIHNALLGATLGIPSFVLNRPHNKLDTTNSFLHRVNSWYDIYDWLLPLAKETKNG